MRAVVLATVLALGGCVVPWSTGAALPALIPVNQVTMAQHHALVRLGVLDDDEGLLWLYTEPVTHRGSVLTSMRIAGWSGSLTVSVRLADVVWAEFEPGPARETIRIGRRDGDVVELEFAPGSESERLYDTLCDRVGARCS